MATPSGFSNQKMRGPARHQTLQTMGSDRVGIPTAQMYLYEKTASDITITSVILKSKPNKPELTRIQITFGASHNCLKGDLFRIITGTLEGWEFEVISVVNATTILVLNIGDIEGVEELPQVGDTGKTYRWTTAQSDQFGSLQTSSGPTLFVKDGLSQAVTEDTAVPANNEALPSAMFIHKDGIQVPVTKDTVTPSNTVAVPVEIVSASGTNITITAGDINIQSSDQGLNFDSMRIGDGSGNYQGFTGDKAKVTDSLLLAELQLKADLTETQPVSIASIPLATGAATEAKQDAAITQETAINTKLTTLLATDFSTSAKQDTLATAVGLLAKLTDTQPVSAASLPLPTGASTAAKQDTGNASLSSIDTKLSSQATAAKQDAEAVLIGAVTETAPASDTASSGLNGRLQRISQRITSLIGLFPATLGQKTMANSFAVTLASDQTALSVTQTSNTGTVTNTQKTVGTSAVRATVSGAAPSATRKRLMIKPSKNNTGSVFIGDSGVTTANGMEIIGPDRLEFLLGASDYYLISDTAAQVVEILEVV